MLKHDCSKIRRRIRAARKREHMTQARFAELACYGGGDAVSDIERGRVNTVESLAALALFAEIFGVSEEFLVFGIVGNQKELEIERLAESLPE